MPSVGRKFLLAGKGGLNLTHAEPSSPSSPLWRARRWLAPLLQRIRAEQVRDLGARAGHRHLRRQFGRVFPTDMKAAPLLRAWLHRLRGRACAFTCATAGWAGPTTAPASSTRRRAQRASGRAPPCWRWAAPAGSAWAPTAPGCPAAARGVDLAPLRPSNCGFDVGWSEHLSPRHAGAPLKSWPSAGRAPTARGCAGGRIRAHRHGVEGSLVYAASAALREAIARDGQATSSWTCCRRAT
jgi:predicted flavoprotein YhiN